MADRNPEIYSYTHRMPLETAIELIEQLTGESGIDRKQLHEQAKQQAGEQIIWWVDHAIMLLRSSGYVKRFNVCYGTVIYIPTARWSDRDEVLGDLRPPKKKNRDARDRMRLLAKNARLAAMAN